MKTELSAGGVIVRKRGRGWQVLILRDMAGNWTFPKGMIEKEESARQAAVREIGEEVGVTDLVYVKKLPTVKYVYERKGLIQKTVEYFLFQSRGRETLVPQKEEGISAIKWIGLFTALQIIGYSETNKSLLMEAKNLL